VNKTNYGLYGCSDLAGDVQIGSRWILWAGSLNRLYRISDKLVDLFFQLHGSCFRPDGGRGNTTIGRSCLAKAPTGPHSRRNCFFRNSAVLSNQVDVSLHNVRELLELSAQKLVMFEFWAAWSEESQPLSAALYNIAGRYPEHLVLARVNCDSEQQLAMHFGVRSLPTVLFIRDGQPVDGFAGVETEAQILGRLEPLLPKPEDLLLQQVQPLVAAQDFSAAYPLLKQAFALDANRVDIRLQLAFCAASLGQTAQAEELISAVRLADQDALYQQVVSLIELAKQAADSPEIRALEQQLQADPENLLLKQQLAVQYQQVQRFSEALALLFSILRQDLNFGESKKLLLDMLAVLPKGDALAGEYRRKLYSLLY